jgi:enoyl-CoA hydratase/carnithine racemase
MYDSAGAVAAGYLDRIVPAADVESEAIDEARRLGAFSARAYSHTKLALRQAMIDRVLDRLDDDMVAMTTPQV